MSTTLFEKLWSEHEIAALDDADSLLYIDRIFLHERTGSVALESLFSEGRRVRGPERVFCGMDHIIDTLPGRDDTTLVPGGSQFIYSTREATRQAGIRLFDVNDSEQGIVQPGCTLVCPDSHTCSQGALGALAWGIGSSQAEHAMATSTLVVKKPRTMRVVFSGTLSPLVTAKDLTLCNMAVEFSAFTAVIAPDQKVFNYLRDHAYAPAGESWEWAMAYWRSLYSEPGARFDREIELDCGGVGPTVNWGTSPQQVCKITDSVPMMESEGIEQERAALISACEYMGVTSGQPLQDLSIDAAFIGSCTNSRITDRRLVARPPGRKVAPHVRAICVPGSQAVKREAEAEGLDRVFREAGFEWREPGCSMCFFAGGKGFGYRERVATTTNRNFEGRQCHGVRSHLGSPATVAASALAGRLADPRDYLT